MLYPVVLFVHSWLRWLVLGLGAAVVIRAQRAKSAARAWTAADDRLGRVLVLVVDTQLALGILMYLWLSPTTHAAFQDVGVAMKSSVTRFFLIEHPFAMLLGAIGVHVARVLARRRPTDPDKHRFTAVGMGLALLCFLVGVPWHFLPYARPYARFSAPGAEVSAPEKTSDETRALFQSRCAPCHGPEGRGDGSTAANLVPRPRNFHDEAWQRATSDEQIERIIRQGGLAVGKSILMPPNPDLSADQARALRIYIRDLGR
jgi:mono/diheme cytochrome c family protein